MSSPSSAPVLASTQKHAPKQEFSRPSSAGYHATLWGDRFLVYTPLSQKEESKLKQQIEELREQVRGMLTATFDHDRPMQKLSLTEAIQRLGDNKATIYPLTFLRGLRIRMGISKHAF